MNRRQAAALLASAVAVVTLAIPTVVGATATFSFTRLSGATRYDTAGAVARATSDTASSVVLASGEDYADAVTAAYVAGLGDVPILLTAGRSLPAATAEAIDRLGAGNVLIVGGTKAVSAGVESDLRGRGLSTRRLAGATRYATARLVAESAGASGVGTLDGVPAAVLVSGQVFPDALAVGGVAFAGHLPILLTPRSSLASEARAALQGLGVRRVLVAGGTDVVSESVTSSLTAMGIAVTRRAGQDRAGTAAAVADFSVASLGFDPAHVDLASGATFADALAIGAHAGRHRTPLLLTNSASDIGAATRTWLLDHASSLTSGHLAGGLTAITAGAEADATAAAKGQAVAGGSGGSGSGSGGGSAGAPGAAEVTTTTVAPSDSSSTSTTSTTTPGTTTSSTTSTTSTTSTSTTSTTVPPPPAACPPDRPSGSGEPFCFPAATDDVLGPHMVDPAHAYVDALIVDYDRPVDCATIAPADYEIRWDGGREVTPGWARCADGTDRAVVLKLAIGEFRPGDQGTVALTGDVRSPHGHGEPADDTVHWVRVDG